jgi:hypothetical protein
LSCIFCNLLLSFLARRYLLRVPHSKPLGTSGLVSRSVYPNPYVCLLVNSVVCTV